MASELVSEETPDGSAQALSGPLKVHGAHRDSIDSEKPNLVPAIGAPASSSPPTSKPDKPKPHVCVICGRGFARLEHLKRHERSHTKEKPFECNDCHRKFARRDLLLRHQQKLHASTTPPARQRSCRRDSMSSAALGGAGRIRKNSLSSGSGFAKPRANTTGHVDAAQLSYRAALNSMGAQKTSPPRNPDQRPGFYRFHRYDTLDRQDVPLGPGMASSMHRPPRGLTPIETRGLPLNVGGNLHTAPPYHPLPPEYGMEAGGDLQGNTVNPAELHFADSPSSLPFDTPRSPHPPGYSLDPAVITEEAPFWMTSLNHVPMMDDNEQAIEGSSPSVESSGSYDFFNDPSQDVMEVGPSAAPWQPSMLSHPPMMATDFTMDMPPMGFGMRMAGQALADPMDLKTNMQLGAPFQMS